MSERVERVFWVIAALALGIYALSLVETRVYQSYLDWQFAAQLKAPAPAGPKGIPDDSAINKSEPAEGHPLGRLETPAIPSTAKTAEGQALGRLEIPAIHLSAMIAEGVEASTLRRSIGHVPGTALPGPVGNVALSAHRDTFFRHLADVHRGDLISITTLKAKLDYVVESRAIVNADDSSVLRDGGRPMLTLVTCYPFYYVGPAPKRFVVQASLAGY